MMSVVVTMTISATTMCLGLGTMAIVMVFVAVVVGGFEGDGYDVTDDDGA